MSEPVIAVEGLAFRYRPAAAPAVDGMSFTVAGGEVFGFLGPSGAGKTTTQQILIGLLHGWTGEVNLLGRELRAWDRDLYDRIGVSFELPVGYPRFTAREDLEHFADLHRRPAVDIGELLDELGLSDAERTPIGGYSKGMRMRLNLARALLHQPELLFLDEPTSGLDPVGAGRVRRLIGEQRRHGRTVFVTTHDMATAAMCDRVAFVVDGRIAACDDPRSLQLAHGRRMLRVEHRVGGRLQSEVFPLDEPTPGLAHLLASGAVETAHTEEASLDQVFAMVTGATL